MLYLRFMPVREDTVKISSPPRAKIFFQKGF